MATQKNSGVSFIQFLQNLEGKAINNNNVVENLKRKLEEENQLKLENKLRAVAKEMNDKIERLRQLRKMETKTKSEIKDLEIKAQKILDGEDED